MNPEYAKNNIEEVPFGQYMEQYRAMDPEAASARSGIPYDKEKQLFTVRLMQKEYTVSWPEFEVTAVPGADHDGNYAYEALTEQTDAKIFVIRYLLNGKGVRTQGNYLTYRDLPNGELYFRQFQGRCLRRMAYGFGLKLEKFALICRQIGASQLNHGDVSFEIEFINDHYVRFILWAGDEEFPPSAQILFSDNFPLSFETYDLAVVGDISITTFKKMQ